MPPPCRTRSNDLDRSTLAIQKLGDALAIGHDPLQDRKHQGAKPKLVKRSDRVAVVFLPDGIDEPWEERPEST